MKEFEVFFAEKVEDNQKYAAIVALYLGQHKKGGHMPIDGAFADDTRRIQLWVTPEASPAQVRAFKKHLGEIMGRKID